MTRLAQDKSALDKPRAAAGRPWLAALRQAASDRFLAVGYPTTAQEAWRFTNVTAIARAKFAPASSVINEAVTRTAVAAGFPHQSAAELVFINGQFAPALSYTGKLPRGVTVRPLAEVIAQDDSILQPHLAEQAPINENPFVALNTASFTDGGFIHIPRGVTVEGAIHLLFISDTSAEPTANHPRVLIVAEDNAELTVVESFIAARGLTFTNAVTEIVAGADSRISYNRIQQGGDEPMMVTTLAANLGRGSQLVSHAATLGGKLTRNDLNITLAGPAADATLNGLVILANDQHCDNHTLLDHAAPHCPSHELYKHVLDGKSSCVFKGQILVRADSQKTDSKQTSKSLLLSDDATMNSQPALEIYADDVKCTHGSTTGPVDEEMVFYLRSRGVGWEAARHLLTYAFAADVTRRIKVEPFRRRVEDFLAAQHGLPRDIRITDLGQHDEKAR
jgi:Fe-S cluster assembly protein SufD